MDRMFTSWRLGRLELSNRLVRSATWEGLADPDGLVTDKLIDLTVKLARGRVGLIIGGYVFVTPDGRGLPGQTGIDHDRCTESLARLVEKVHRAGGLMAAQLAHAGGHTKTEWIGTKPAGPSARFNDGLKEDVIELSRDRIAELVAAFGAAASRAKQAGYDAVQLHGAHGYLISQFLSPFFNQRTDDYGGDLTNRARFVGQVYQAVRQAVGPDFPVFIKLNTIDGLENGLEPVEAVEVAKDLAAQGMDAIEVSGGVAGGGKASPQLSGPGGPERRRGRLLPGPGQGGQGRGRLSGDQRRRLARPGVDQPSPGISGRRIPEPAPHPGAGPGQALESRRPSSGDLRLLRPLPDPGPQRRNSLRLERRGLRSKK